MADAPEHLIVVGASAGGIAALSTLVSTLPSPFPAPILIANISQRSHLEEILQRHTALPVRTVVEHQVLEAGAFCLS